MTCPLCRGEVKVFKGSTDASGGHTLPYAFCECGFEYKPKLKITGLVGEDGWGLISRTFEKTLERIREVIK